MGEGNGVEQNGCCELRIGGGGGGGGGSYLEKL